MRLTKFLKNTFMSNRSAYITKKRLKNDNKRILHFYSQFVKRGDLCFDVGANIGNRTKIFLQLGAKVVAIEPQAECAKALLENFGKNRNFVLVTEALGKELGATEMYINHQAPTISSLSPKWINTVKQSGRFSNYEWDVIQAVKINTLDNLIRSFGYPKFIKIDVEGYEYEVLSGLSKPVNCLSIEFTPEALNPTYDALLYLVSLGATKFNISLNETLEFISTQWMNLGDTMDCLKKLENNINVFGDVYVRF